MSGYFTELFIIYVLSGGDDMDLVSDEETNPAVQVCILSVTRYSLLNLLLYLVNTQFNATSFLSVLHVHFLYCTAPSSCHV